MSDGMKIAIVGGGAFRTPRLFYGLVRHATTLHINQIDLYDPDPERVDSIAKLCGYLAEKLGVNIRLTVQDSVAATCRDAAFVLLTYRVGGEVSRSYDERVALNNGVLGQETVGPGGFFMALRSLPVTLQYVDQIRTIAPTAWIINFTNPAGIVTEAITRLGERRFVGVCDTPYHLQSEISDFLGVALDQVRVESVGLNHLGWFQRVWYNGIDRVPDLVGRAEELVRTVRPLSFFSSTYIRELGVLPTEYVYLYLHSSEVTERIRERKSRGELIQAQAEAFFPRLQALVQARQWDQAWQEYGRTITDRSNSYLATETASQFPRGLNPDSLFASEGYEGIAIRVMEGVTGAAERTAILNTPSYGVMPGLESSAVIECSCYLDRQGITPLALTRPVPLECIDLIQRTKRFEVLTLTAARTKRLEDAVVALAANPILAGDEELALRIIQERKRRPGFVEFVQG